ncbi:hypothetical protein BZG81_06540 [Salinivibrio sp. MA607]|nr:hypothetical protein BZG81_06540 [Salinivibrio sp. MA607]
MPTYANGAIGVCPIYARFGILNTEKSEKQYLGSKGQGTLSTGPGTICFFRISYFVFRISYFVFRQVIPLVAMTQAQVYIE